jgi:hypothetical protein
MQLFHTLYGGALHSDEVVQQRSAKASARRTQAMLLRVLREELRRGVGASRVYNELSFAAQRARHMWVYLQVNQRKLINNNKTHLQKFAPKFQNFKKLGIVSVFSSVSSISHSVCWWGTVHYVL